MSVILTGCTLALLAVVHEIARKTAIGMVTSGSCHRFSGSNGADDADTSPLRQVDLASLLTVDVDL